MKPGSVIVDLAAAPGGGRQLPAHRGRPTVVKHGVTIVGETNLAGAGRPPTRRALYARNVLDFLKLVLPRKARSACRWTTTSSPPA